jgi:NTP pyrophosphatase (non-canonical NTP hydrolase)
VGKMNKTLVILQEECAELIHIISKIHRFGLHDQNNRQRLIQETGDVMAMINCLLDEEAISDEELENAVALKIKKLKVWAK